MTGGFKRRNSQIGTDLFAGSGGPRNRATASAALVALACLAAACSPDDPVPGPCGQINCSADVVTPDASETDTGPLVRSLNFYVETPTGNVLEGTTTSASITDAADKYPGDKGIQVDVVVIGTKNLPDGTPVEALVNGTASGAAATIANGTARIAKVSIPCAVVPVELTVRATVSPTDKVDAAKALEVTCTGCKAALAPVESCISEDVDPGTPGFQRSFTVTTTTPTCSHAYIEVTDTAGKKDTSAKVLLNGIASVSVKVTLSPNDKGLTGNKATIMAVVEDQQNTDRPSGQSAPADVFLLTEKPEITVKQPLPGQLTSKDDTDPVAPGIQSTLVGTATTMKTDDVGKITLSIDGAPPVTTTLNVKNEFQFPLSFPTSKTYSLKIAATNFCGLEGTKPVAYSVFGSQAKLIIQDPAPAAVLLAKSDGDPLGTPLKYETTVVVGLQDGTPDSEVSIFCRKSGAGNAYGVDPVGKAKYVDVTATTLPVAVTLDVEGFGTSVTCIARDNAPNGGESPEVTFTVALPAPCLDVVVPTAGSGTNKASLSIGLSASNLEGATVKAHLVSGTGVNYDAPSVGKVSKGAFVGALALSFGTPPAKIADGVYTVTFDAVDGLGNHAVDSACSDPVRIVTIDTAGPLLAVTLPAKATLTSASDPDSDVTALGYQITVEVSSGDAVQVCLAVGSSSNGCVVPTNGKAVFKSVTLQPGANNLALTGTDAAGNKSTPPATVVTLTADAPVIQFIDPKASLSTTKPNLTFQVKVTQLDGITPIPGILATVAIDGKVDPSIKVTESAGGIYTFTVGNFSPNGTSVQFGGAAPSNPANIVYSAILVVTAKTAKPGIAITAPADGGVLNLASVGCAAGLPDCVGSVIASTSNVEDGSDASLQVTCGKAGASYAAKVIAGSVTFADVFLADQSQCSLVATVTDAADQVASSKKVDVTVDRTAPTFGKLVLPKKDGAQITLVASDDINSDSTDFMQVNLQVLVSGLAKGASIQLDIVDDNGKKTTYSTKMDKDATDAAPAVASFGIVLIPDGIKVQLLFSAADAAGNPATKKIVAQVISSQPEVRLAGPSNNEEGKACKSAADCASTTICYTGKCTVPWNKLSTKAITIITLGVPAGADVRVCSNEPGLTGPSCDSAGYKVVATTKLKSNTVDLAVPVLADGLYTFIAEASLLPTVPWTSSLASSQAFLQSRRILIDTAPPVVASIVAPTAADVPSGCLSSALQSTDDGIQPGGKFTFTVSTLEDATVTLLIDQAKTGSAVTANKIASVVAQLPAEGSVTVSAVAIDQVGNVGEALPFGVMTVNTLPPTGNFAAPTKSPVLAADSLDVAVVSEVADVQGQGVQLLDGGKKVATATIVSGVAKFPHATVGALSEGSHTLQAILQDLCGNKATIATQPTTVVVDTKGPELTFNQPAPQAKFTDTQDADSATGGYQVAVEFATTDATSWTLELGFDCDVGFANCAGFQQVGKGSVKNPGKAEPKINATVPFGATPNYNLRLTGLDANGNSLFVERGFQVALSGCLVQLKGLPATGGYNTQACPSPGQNCASVVAKLSVDFVGPCGNVGSVRLTKDGVEVGSKAPTGSTAAFDLVVPDGASFNIEALVINAGATKGSSGPNKVIADFTNPVVTFAAATVAGKATVVNGSLQGKSQDLDANLAGHQAHLSLKVTDSGLVGGKLTQLTRSVAGGPTAELAQTSQKLPLTFTAVSQAIELQAATFGENAVNVITAKVEDALGNVATATASVTVDWVAPAQPVLNAFAASDLNPRRPMARLTFTAVGDNGALGKAASYIARYSRKPIVTEKDFADACDVKALPLASVATPSAAGATDQIIVEGPDSRPPTDLCRFSVLTDNAASKYYFAVAAIDVAGNVSLPSVALATDALRLRYAKITLGGTFDTLDMRTRFHPAGDLNGDGLGELAMGGGATAPLCIIYGRLGSGGALADIVLDSPSGPDHVCLTNAGGLGAPVASPGDVNADGIADLVVGLGTGAGKPRTVLVFLGKKNQKVSTVPDVTISGIANVNFQTFGVWRISVIGNFNGDVAANQLPVNDIALVSRAAGSITYDRIFIVPGNAAWGTAGAVKIDLGLASDRIAHNVATIRPVETTGTPTFGNFIGGIGNVFADAGATQYTDLAISQLGGPQQVVLVKGRPLGGDKEILVSLDCCNGPDDATTVHVRPGNSSPGANQYGTYVDFVEFDGDPVPDVLIQHQVGSIIGSLFWLRGKDLATQLGKVVSLNQIAPVPQAPDTFSNSGGYHHNTWHFGAQRIGNFTDQVGTAGRVDIVHGGPKFAPDGSANKVVIRSALVRPTTGVTVALFAYEDIVITDPFKPGNQNWGMTTNSGWGGLIFAPLGDFNGDGLVDLAIGSVDGSLVVVY